VTRKVLILAAIAGAILSCLWSWRVAPVAIVVALVLFLASHIRAVRIERRPQVWRAEWRSKDAPSQVEVARRMRELEELEHHNA
jgi:predicted MFS family arabinose efflux permease